MLTSFNFLLERKNRLITTLMRATEDSDEQHRRAFQAHTENVSYFLSKHIEEDLVLKLVLIDTTKIDCIGIW